MKSSEKNFKFPEHLIIRNAIVHRANEEACYYVWVNKKGELHDLSEASTNLDIQSFDDLVVYLEKIKKGYNLFKNSDKLINRNFDVKTRLKELNKKQNILYICPDVRCADNSIINSETNAGINKTTEDLKLKT